MRFIIKNGIPRVIFNTTVINNGVIVNRDIVFPQKPFHLFQELITSLSNFTAHSKNHSFEAGLYLSHLRVTNPNDSVLSVGLGSGHTLIPIVKMLDSEGFYRCIEASAEQIDIARNNVESNLLDESKYEIINAYAGKEVFDAYGTRSNYYIDINDYDFDILEMDCEGSELSILKSLKKFPRNIIVELHPSFYEEDYKDFDALIQLFFEIGYEYQFSYGHNGVFLEIEIARSIYNSSINNLNDGCGKKKSHQYYGSCPIVVTFLKVKTQTHNI